LAGKLKAFRNVSMSASEILLRATMAIVLPEPVIPWLYPQLYFTQVLMNLPQTNMSDLAAWLPDQWKLAHAKRLANTKHNPAYSVKYAAHIAAHAKKSRFAFWC
jgi:hypothetical protein